MNGHDWLVYLGIKMPDLVAGMFGGIVKALVFHRDKPFESVVSGVVGALMANYLGEGLATQFAKWWTDFAPGRGAVCFITGIIAMVLCQAIIDRAKAWSSKGQGNA